MKKRSFPTTGIFVALVMSFAAWTYFSEYKGLEKKTAEKEKSAAILPFSNSKVTSFRLKDFDKPAPSDETWLRKDGDQWKLDKPMTDLGDPMAIETFLSGLSAQKIKDTVVEAPDIAWATFGLDKPQLEAQVVASEEGKEVVRKIAIGSTPAFDGSVYGRLDNENRVVLFESTVEALLMKESRDFRDKRFFPAATHPAFSKADFKVQGRNLSLEKVDGKWKFAGAKSKAAVDSEWPLDSDKVQAWVESVAGLRAYDIWAEDKSDPLVIRGRRLDKPVFEAKLVAEKNEPYQVNVAALGKEEAVAAATGSARPLVFSLNRNVIESLLKTVDDLRDVRFPFTPKHGLKIADVARVEIERPKSREALPAFERDGSKWKIASGAAKDFAQREINQESLDQFLVATTQLSARKIFSRNSAPAKVSLKLGAKKDESGFAVKFKASDGGSILELLIADSAGSGLTVAGGQFLATSSKAPGFIFELDRAAVDSIPIELLKPIKEVKP